MQKISDEDIHDVLDHYGNSPPAATAMSENQDPLNFTDPLLVSFQPRQQTVKADDVFSGDPLKADTPKKDPEDDNAIQFAKSPGNFLQNDWHELFDTEDYLRMVRERALQGRLGYSSFRGVCWKLFWECLPEERENWISFTSTLRADYENIRDKHLTDPYRSATEIDLAVNNPLSQEEESPWHQYFQDGELRSTICKDLERLYPEMEFFRKEEINNIILRCLFVYAKEHPHIVYKQGMHEILAPVVYVLWENSQNVKDSKEDLQEVILVLNDQKYIEHDAFCLFSQIMDTLEPMFVNHRPLEDDGGNDRQKVADVDNLFVPSAANQPTSAISKKLTRIQNFMLKRYDHELYSRLQELDIAPQLYGIKESNAAIIQIQLELLELLRSDTSHFKRDATNFELIFMPGAISTSRWIRLLFGREYSLPSVLYLWDAMFADGMSLDLADYIYIAMLMHIRHYLLKNDYSTSLMQLMKYPASTDAKMILRKALSLRMSKPQGGKAKKPTTNLQSKRVNDRNASLRRNLSESLTQEQKFAQVLGSSKTQFAKKIGPVKFVPKSAQWYAQSVDGTKNREVETSEVGTKREVFAQEVKRSRTWSAEIITRESLLEKPETRRTDKSPRNVVSQISNAIGKHTAGLSNDVLSKFASRGKNRPKEANVSQLEEDHERLQKQVSQLQSEFDRLQSLCLFCAGKMDSYLGFVDTSIDEEPSSNEVTKTCINGLKQVRDILSRTTNLKISTDAYEQSFSSIDKNLSMAFSDIPAEMTEGTHGEHLTLEGNENYFSAREPINQDLVIDSGINVQIASDSRTHQRITVDQKPEIAQDSPSDSREHADSDGFDYLGYTQGIYPDNPSNSSSSNSGSNSAASKSESSTPSCATPEPWGYLRPIDSPGDFEKELSSIKDNYGTKSNDKSKGIDEFGTALEDVPLHGGSFTSKHSDNDELNSSLDPLSALEQHFS